jgi:MscS family membrane protein
MDFLDTIILGNTVRNYCIVAGVILFVLFFKKALSRYVAAGLYFVIKAIWKIVDKAQFVTLVFKPMGWFLSVTVALIALNKLNYPAAWEFSLFKIPFNEILDKVGVAVFLISFIKLLLSVIDFIALTLSRNTNIANDKTDNQLLAFFKDFLKVIITIIGILLILKGVFNQNLGYILTSLSIVGAALALSAKESLENLIASFIIFFDKPFFVGDFLKVNNVTGTVERIGLRSTRIRTADKTLVTVPNKQMVDSVVDNISMRNGYRAELRLELSGDTPAAKMTAFIEDIAKMLDDKKQAGITTYTVFLNEFSKTGSTIAMDYFTDLTISITEFNALKQEVNISLMEMMRAADIKMATTSSNIIMTSNEPQPPKSNPII